MRSIRARNRGLRRWAGVSLATIVVFVAGCSWSSVPRARIVAAPAPALPPERPLPALADDSSTLPWVISEADRLTETAHVTWAAAREAFWNHETERAVELLRELRQHDAIGQEHFQDLLLQCYERSERWAEMLPVFSEFGLEESYAGWVKHAKFMAGLPKREVEFPAAPATVAIRLKRGLVVAEGTINGVKVPLLLDTGANVSWISLLLARRAGIRPAELSMSLHDANGASRDVAFALIRELRFGGVTVRNAASVIGRGGITDLISRTVSFAIIGWDVLQHLDITWDFPGRRMTLAPPSGAISAAPNISGRIQPIFTVLSGAGRPLHLFFDSGAAGTGSIDLYEHEGVLATKTPIGDFRRKFRPSLQAGMHSISISWHSEVARPFTIWMSGYRFELPSADLERKDAEQEHWCKLDGVIGNGPFLGGTLRISGTRREAVFELNGVASATARAEGAN